MAAVAHDESLAEDEILRRALEVELKKAVSDANTRDKIPAFDRDLQTYPVCQPHARGIQRKVPGRNCHKSCRRAARPTQHRRTPAASSDTRRPACDAHVAPTCR